MNEPELLILDEPTTGLDPAVRLALWSRIRELRARGTSVLLTTHYMDEAERLCDELVILAEGRVVARGAPKALIRETLAADALELDLPLGRGDALLGRLSGVRSMRVGDRLMLYAGDGAALLDRVREVEPEPGLVAVRPAQPGGRVPLAHRRRPGGGAREGLARPRALGLAAQLRALPAHVEAQSPAELLRAGAVPRLDGHRRGRVHPGDGRDVLHRVPGPGARGGRGDERCELRGDLQRVRTHELPEDLRVDADHAHPTGGRARGGDPLGRDALDDLWRRVPARDDPDGPRGSPCAR